MLAALEALLFSSDQPLTPALLAESLDSEPEQVQTALAELGESYTARGAGVELREIAGGWMLVTTAAQAEWVGRMLRGKRKMRLSRPALETMAIVAYKQPVTKTEIEAIRGVDSTGVLATLLERNLLTIKGRSKVVGRPLLYGTTPEFLDYFGLRDLSELPRPEELRALVAAREPEQLEMMEAEVVSQVATDLALAEAAGEERERIAEVADMAEASDMVAAASTDDEDELEADEFDDDDDDDEDDDDAAWDETDDEGEPSHAPGSDPGR
jgi:segregation and condensation protein B